MSLDCFVDMDLKHKVMFWTVIVYSQGTQLPELRNVFSLLAVVYAYVTLRIAGSQLVLNPLSETMLCRLIIHLSAVNVTLQRQMLT